MNAITDFELNNERSLVEWGACVAGVKCNEAWRFAAVKRFAGHRGCEWFTAMTDANAGAMVAATPAYVWGLDRARLPDPQAFDAVRDWWTGATTKPVMIAAGQTGAGKTLANFCGIAYCHFFGRGLGDPVNVIRANAFASAAKKPGFDPVPLLRCQTHEGDRPSTVYMDDLDKAAFGLPGLAALLDLVEAIVTGDTDGYTVRLAFSTQTEGPEELADALLPRSLPTDADAARAGRLVSSIMRRLRESAEVVAFKHNSGGK